MCFLSTLYPGCPLPISSYHISPVPCLMLSPLHIGCPPLHLVSWDSCHTFLKAATALPIQVLKMFTVHCCLCVQANVEKLRRLREAFGGNPSAPGLVSASGAAGSGSLSGVCCV
jgi:hypothetical protein